MAKLVALGLAAAVVSLYATLVLLLFWGPDLVVPFYLSLTLSGLTYGGIGILLGVLFRTELAGIHATSGSLVLCDCRRDLPAPAERVAPALVVSADRLTLEFIEPRVGLASTPRRGPCVSSVAGPARGARPNGCWTPSWSRSGPRGRGGRGQRRAAAS